MLLKASLKLVIITTLNQNLKKKKKNCEKLKIESTKVFVWQQLI